MASKRYTIVIADRDTGTLHRFTLSLRPTLCVLSVLLSLPILMGLGARWGVHAELQALRVAVTTLEQENSSYRAATKELTGQIESIESALATLSTEASLDPASARALAKLPEMVKIRALGGALDPVAPARSFLAPVLASPEDTFGIVRDLLGRLESRLQVARTGIEKRAALAAATPSVWPVIGWLSASFGSRPDPFTGSQQFHPGIDISADKGTPVYAAAAGTVLKASYEGAYGNMVTIDHGYGLVTRYAHLSAVLVRAGDRVERLQMIGRVGTTGRTTGPHLHYELLVNGQLTNPLRLLTDVTPRASRAR